MIDTTTKREPSTEPNFLSALSKGLNKTIRPGDEVRDTITGYSGIAISRTVHLFSAPRVCIQPKAMDGAKPVEDCWFDEGRLELI
jgi:hypothetical protein